MRLLSLEIENWGPYGGVQSMEMDTSPSAPVVLVEGENERGKTSLFLALRYALYGKMRDHDDNEISPSDMANWNARDAGEPFWFGAVLRFSHGGQELELTRRCKGKAETRLDGPSVKVLETRAQLRRVGGDPFPEKEIDNQIQRILHSDIASFFLFDGETLARVERILKSEDSGSIFVRDSLERALGIPALRLTSGDVDELTEEAGAEVRKAAKEAKVSKEATDRLQRADDDLTRAIEDSEKLDTLEKVALETLNAAQRQLADVDAIKDAYYERRHLDEQANRDRSDLEDTEASIRQILESTWWLPLGNRLESAANEALDALAEHSKRTETRMLLRNELHELDLQLGDGNCRTCGQRIPAAAIQSLRTREAELKSRLESAEQLEESAEDVRERARKLRKFMGAAKIQTQLEEFEGDAKRLRLRLIDANGKIDRLTEVIQGTNLDIAVLDAQVGDAKEDLYKIAQGRKEVESRKAAAIRERKQATEDIGRLTGVGGKRATAELEILKLLSGILDGAIGAFRNEMRVKIQEEASDIFRQLTTESEYEGLRIDGNYYLSIVDANDRIVKRRSAGANQVVTMSLIGALAKCSVEEGPIVMDTPFARLDKGHRSRILQWTAALGSQVVLFVQSGEFERERDLRYLDGRVGRSFVLRRIGANATRIEDLSHD